MNATMSAWPTVVYDRCEANYAMVPGIAEFWSSITGLAIVAAGLLPLLTSEYSDDLLDVVNAFITLNGVAATLAHGTLLRVVGQADALSINLGVLLFVKALVMAHSPRMTQQAGRRTCLNLAVVFGMLLSITWNPSNVPGEVAVDLTVIGLPILGVIALGFMISLGYGQVYWHLGKLKRVFLRATLIYAVGLTAWIMDEADVLPCPCPVSLHPVWHICSSHSLCAWTAFVKYYRGKFFGFEVELKGPWWAPYTTWSPPADAENHPIVRHATPGPVRPGGRRNTYIAPKLARPKLTLANRGEAFKQAWRGESFLRAALRQSALLAGQLSAAAGGQRAARRSSVTKPGEAAHAAAGAVSPALAGRSPALAARSPSLAGRRHGLDISAAEEEGADGKGKGKGRVATPETATPSPSGSHSSDEAGWAGARMGSYEA